MSKPSFLSRFLTYQKERFPFLGHGLLIAMFTFSAVAYSRICRGVDGFIDWQDFVVGFIATLGIFLLVRVLDEFKDQEIDALYRQELPVPRGLVTLGELKWVGIATATIIILGISIQHPSMLWMLGLVLGYLALMTVEFFAHDWLSARPWVYAGSHMIIIPLVDLYASGLDWYLEGARPHLGLFFFFCVSYFNGMVLEVGRKLKSPEAEKEGVVTYSSLYGVNKGSNILMGFLTLTAVMAAVACWYAGLSPISYLVLGLALVVSTIVVTQYKATPVKAKSKRVEIISGIWTLLMYGTLGGIPGLLNYLLP